MSELINQRGVECPVCGYSDRTLRNTYSDNREEIYCDRCAQHYASEDYGEPFEPTETPRHDVRDLIVRHLGENIFEDEDSNDGL